MFILHDLVIFVKEENPERALERDTYPIDWAVLAPPGVISLPPGGCAAT